MLISISPVVLPRVAYHKEFKATSYNVIAALIYYLLVAEVPIYYGIKRPKSVEKYLKQGIEHAVVEFETVKRILIVVIPMVAIFLALEITSYFKSYEPSFLYLMSLLSPIPSLFSILLPLTCVGIGGHQARKKQQEANIVDWRTTSRINDLDAVFKAAGTVAEGEREGEW